MALTDSGVQKQINHMMAFIEREADEKAEEIDTKADEEFTLEKGRLVQEQRLKIIEFYDRKEKQVEMQKKIQSSNMMNQARLRVLKAREQHVMTVLDEARRYLFDITKDQTKYQEIVRRLIIQALLQLMESEVTIRCRHQDMRLVQACVDSALKEYQNLTKQKCKVAIDKENFLPSDICGGIDAYSQRGKIKVSNTLESRLEMISQQLLPEIRVALFGRNPNRKFSD